MIEVAAMPQRAECECCGACAGVRCDVGGSLSCEMTSREDHMRKNANLVSTPKSHNTSSILKLSSSI